MPDQFEQESEKLAIEKLIIDCEKGLISKQKLNKIIEHYTNRKNMFKFDDKIVRLEDFRKNDEFG